MERKAVRTAFFWAERIHRRERGDQTGIPAPEGPADGPRPEDQTVVLHAIWPSAKISTVNATLRLRRKFAWPGGYVVEMIIWEVPQSRHHPDGLKYRLYCGKDGRCLVRYDNEVGKGSHIHCGDTEVPYRFTTLDQLLADFLGDVARLTGEQG